MRWQTGAGESADDVDDGDGEIACVALIWSLLRQASHRILVRDIDFVDGKMGGANYQSGRFVGSLRRRLWRQHMGRIPPIELPTPRETNNMRGFPSANDYDYGSPNDKLVEDPLSDSLWQQMTAEAAINREVRRLA
jgi:hypothetical protein